LQEIAEAFFMGIKETIAKKGEKLVFLYLQLNILYFCQLFFNNVSYENIFYITFLDTFFAIMEPKI
jgi:hypothetical protein